MKLLASRIQRPGEQLQTAIDRVRNWTKESLLTLEGEKNPGTGRSRKYAEEALLEASLLDVMSDFGMPASRLAPYLTLLKKLAGKYWKPPSQKQQLSNNRSRHRPSPTSRPLLVIGKTVGSTDLSFAFVNIAKLPSHILSEKRNVYTVVDLQLLFDRLLET